MAEHLAALSALMPVSSSRSCRRFVVTDYHPATRAIRRAHAGAEAALLLLPIPKTGKIGSRENRINTAFAQCCFSYTIIN
jgi:hypothetical protein